MDHRQKKIAFALPAAASIPAILIMLEYYDVQIPVPVIVGFFLIWLVCFACDAVYTVLNRRMIGYESNVMFPVLYAKLGPFAVPVQALVDLGFASLITVIITGSLNFGYIFTVAAIFGLLHLDAYCSNRKFLQNFP